MHSISRLALHAVEHRQPMPRGRMDVAVAIPRRPRSASGAAWASGKEAWCTPALLEEAAIAPSRTGSSVQRAIGHGVAAALACATGCDAESTRIVALHIRRWTLLAAHAAAGILAPPLPGMDILSTTPTPPPPLRCFFFVSSILSI